jgi:DNA repair ATPase RecN
MNKKELELELESCNVYVNMDDYDSADQLIEDVIDNSYYAEDITYYTRAIEYLSDNDPSLQESMEIASEYGYEVESITSELLASLLKTRENEEAFYELKDEIEEYYDNIEEA